MNKCLFLAKQTSHSDFRSSFSPFLVLLSFIFLVLLFETKICLQTAVSFAILLIHALSDTAESGHPCDFDFCFSEFRLLDFPFGSFPPLLWAILKFREAESQNRKAGNEIQCHTPLIQHVNVWSNITRLTTWDT